MKLRKYNVDGVEIYNRVQFWCPGCNIAHTLATDIHEFNDNMDSPTFTPSIGVTSELGYCHSYITDGKIRFEADSFHTLKGQTVDLPDIEQ